MSYGGGSGGGLFAAIDTGTVVDEFHFGISAVHILRPCTIEQVAIKYILEQSG